MAKGRKKQKKGSTGSRSWESIKQSFGRAVTPQAKKRRWAWCLKVGGLSCAGLSLFGMIGAGMYFLNKQSTESHFNSMKQVVGQVEFDTDGVLSDAWLNGVLELPNNAGMLDLDIFELKKKLENVGQIKRAVIERQFPETLKIKINEHRPVLKVVFRNEEGRKEGLLVSEAGEIYKGHGYSREFVKNLLYIEGVELHRKKEGFRPVEQMEAVVDLLTKVKEERPHLYAQWSSISFEYLKGGRDVLGAFIKIKTKNAGDIIFAPEHFDKQLERLDSIMSYVGEPYMSAIERIDLSLDGQAAVQVARNNSRQRVR